MSLSLLIVEDESIIADDLCLCVEELGYQVAGIAQEVTKAIQLIESEEPDMVLLDIMLKGNQTGIDLATIIQDKYHLPFIFLTSLYDQKTVELANKTKPMAYVVKPFKDADLQVALQMAWRKYKLESKRTLSTKQIFVRHNGAIKPLDPNDILYVEASDNYATFYATDEKYVVTQTLKKIEEELVDSGFCRIHKTYLINLSKIDLIEHSVVFIGGRPLPIGKVYRKDFMQSITVF